MRKLVLIAISVLMLGIGTAKAAFMSLQVNTLEMAEDTVIRPNMIITYIDTLPNGSFTVRTPFGFEPSEEPGNILFLGVGFGGGVITSQSMDFNGPNLSLTADSFRLDGSNLLPTLSLSGLVCGSAVSGAGWADVVDDAGVCGATIDVIVATVVDPTSAPVSEPMDLAVVVLPMTILMARRRRAY